MGDKINARNLMAAAGVPVVARHHRPGRRRGRGGRCGRATIGFPVMVKASAGGGGMGMAVATDEASLRTEYEQGPRRSPSGCSATPSVLIERFFPRVRHVEVQILGLADGRVVALGERDCSVQRRNQKLVEETPSPAVDPGAAARLLAAAVRAGEAVGYRNAGTVECLLDADVRRVRLPGDEHPAAGRAPDHRDGDRASTWSSSSCSSRPAEPVDLRPGRARRAPGTRIELRVNAEDPKRFLPGPGRDHHLGGADRRRGSGSTPATPPATP